jgi:hypothetical protein
MTLAVGPWIRGGVSPSLYYAQPTRRYRNLGVHMEILLLSVIWKHNLIRNMADVTFKKYSRRSWLWIIKGQHFWMMSGLGTQGISKT